MRLLNCSFPDLVEQKRPIPFTEFKATLMWALGRLGSLIGMAGWGASEPVTMLYFTRTDRSVRQNSGSTAETSPDMHSFDFYK